MLDQMHRISKRADLERALEIAQPHLKPIVRAIRDHNVRMLFVPQDASAFRLPKGGDRGAITIIGDDMLRVDGPEGFHMPSVRRSIRSANWFAVVSCEPIPKVYEAAALLCATTRGNALIVETRPEQEIQWIQLIQKLAPGRPLCIATVEGTPC